MEKQTKVSIIIPNKNSAHMMKDFFESALLSTYKNFEIIVNDDVTSSDNLQTLCEEYKTKGLNIIYLRENISMAQGRKSGSKHATGYILLHLDSDMRISKGLLSECVEKINSGYDALVIPEDSYGEGFWAKVKWLEKKCYQGVEWMESLRCVKKDVYEKLGGHNEQMVFSEDKDFDIRVHNAGYKIGRTESIIRHYEGKLTFWKTISKKQNYSKTSDVFQNNNSINFKYSISYFWQYWFYLTFKRYFIFIKNYKYIFTHPILYLGLWIMKTGEYAAAALGILKNKLSNNMKQTSIIKILILALLVTNTAFADIVRHEVNFAKKTSNFGTDLQKQINECFDKKSCEGIILPPGYFYLDRSIYLQDNMSLTGSTSTRKTVLLIAPTVKNAVIVNNGNSNNIHISNLVLDLHLVRNDTRTSGLNIRNSSGLDLQNIDILNATTNSLSITGSSTDKTICSNLNLANININKTSTTSASGVVISNCQNIVADTLKVLGVGKDGLVLDRVTNSTIQNSTFEGNGGNGISLSSSAQINLSNSTSTKNILNGLNIVGTTTDSKIFGTFFTMNSKNGISIAGKGVQNLEFNSNTISQNKNSGLAVSGNNNVSVLNNYFEKNENDALSVAGIKNVTISGNKFNQNKQDGIQVGNLANTIKITDNEIVDTGFIATDTKVKTSGINLVKGAENIVVEHNVVKNDVGTTSDYGLLVNDGVSKVFAKNNTFDGNSVAEVKFGTNTSNVCIYGDKSMTNWVQMKCFVQKLILNI